MAFGGERSVTARLRADVGQYVAQMGIAAKATRDVATSTVKSAQDSKAAWTTVGTAVAGFGAVTLGAVGVAAKAAIDWESAWAGVRKTVDGSDAEMAALEAELRNLAKTLPATHTEIAAVAEAAGQLGIKRESIVGFTRTMIALGETTNLSADEAATAIAQMANIMGTSQDDVDKLGASLVALGNDGASTERDIVRMALRISGAGKTIGLTEGEVLGFANALASMGVEVEAGGTAISRVMLTIQKAVDMGGEDLVKFARVAGMSADDFRTAFQQDAAGAIAAFVTGLGRADKAGQNTTSILEDLELGEIRVSDALRRLSANSGLLTDSLELGNRAWDENRALVEEAAKRYETTEAQIQVAMNNIKDAGITVGEALLPALSKGADLVVALTEAFEGLPEPIKNMIGPLGALVGGVALLAGGALIVIPRLVELGAAVKVLNRDMPRTASVMGRLGRAASAAAAIYALGVAFAQLAERNREAVRGLEQTTSAVLDLAEGADIKSIDALFAGFSGASGSVKDFASGVDRIVNSGWDDKIVDFGDGLFGIENEADRARAQIENLGQSLALMVEAGNAQQARGLFDDLKKSLEMKGVKVTTEQLMALMPAYAEALAAADNEQRNAAGGADTLSTGLGGVGETAQEAKDRIDALVQSLIDAGLVQLSTRDAARNLEQAIDDAADSLKENGRSMDITTQKGRDNQAALDDVARSALQLAQAVYDETGSEAEMRRSLTASREALIKTATKFLGSEEAATKYADAVLGTPKSWETRFTTPGLDEAKDRVARFSTEVRKLPKGHTFTIRTSYITSGRAPANANLAGVAVGSAGGNSFTSVKGGLIHTKAFAAGGDVPNGHVAQHAPAGAWRVWAEDETGGETYIPHANDWRRPRAVSLTRDVASLFGYDLVPRGGVRAFATGGHTSPASSPSAFGPTGPFELVGTLDLGDGLVGMVRGVIRDSPREVAAAANSHNASRRN